ncbi:MULTISPECIES: hypothetical protein [unclassified Salinivibrio]|uniref:hypothetical protein n=1 Tax=unclassified Salinivibrio TaxID=2636825 RepID=UPI00130195E3|nr:MULTISPECIES: hypothetical protein [unclassified Salinivibrio]
MKHKRYSNKKIKEMLNEVMPEMEKAREDNRVLRDQANDRSSDSGPVFSPDDAKK